MSGNRGFVNVATLAMWGALAALVTAQSGQQTFRTATDVVMVDVSVRSGGRNVTGLSAAEFSLTDNGVLQKIDSVDVSAVPLDVTLVVDLSGNPSRPYTIKRPDPAEPSAIVTRELAQVTALLRPSDRVRLVTLDRYVRQVFPFVAKDRIPAIGTLEFDGLASLFDGLAAALMQPVEPARRHVVIARTKGTDGASALTASAVQAFAARADAQFHLVLMETALDNEIELAVYQCSTPILRIVDVGQGPGVPIAVHQPMGLCSPTNRFDVPPLRRIITPAAPHQLERDGLLLKSGAQATGGDVYQAVLLTEPTLTGTFRDAFEDFRSSYVLRYTPAGVARSGWHTINVTVPRSKNYSISARRGYAIEEPKPPPTPAVVATAGLLRTLPELMTAYERGSYAQVAASLRQSQEPGRLLAEFESLAAWPGSPRLEAAFALELAEPAVFWRIATQEKAVALLKKMRRWVRDPLEPGEFERAWFYAALTMLQGAIRPEEIQELIDYAASRFEGEPRFLLLQAINTDQRTVTPSRISTLQAPGAPRTATLDLARQQYEAATAHAGTEAEARIRLGFLLHRAGKPDEALAQLNAAESLTIADADLRYLRLLFLGHVHAAANRPAEAIVAFRSATLALPGAQSARVALMNALLMNGNRPEAASLSELIQTDKGQTPDPWWTYWQGQYRMFPDALTRVRGMAK